MIKIYQKSEDDPVFTFVVKEFDNCIFLMIFKAASSTFSSFIIPGDFNWLSYSPFLCVSLYISLHLFL